MRSATYKDELNGQQRRHTFASSAVAPAAVEAQRPTSSGQIPLEELENADDGVAVPRASHASVPPVLCDGLAHSCLRKIGSQYPRGSIAGAK